MFILINFNGKKQFLVGVEEAHAAGKALKEAGYQFDVAHTSVLKRAQITLQTVLGELGQSDIPINKTWRLNERHYGGLTGLDKAETAAKHGEAQVISINLIFKSIFSAHIFKYLHNFLKVVIIFLSVRV